MQLYFFFVYIWGIFLNSRPKLYIPLCEALRTFLKNKIKNKILEASWTRIFIVVCQWYNTTDIADKVSATWLSYSYLLQLSSTATELAEPTQLATQTELFALYIELRSCVFLAQVFPELATNLHSKIFSYTTEHLDHL